MSLLPLNASPLERAIEAGSAFNIATPLSDLWNPSSCPESALPWLAWALHMTDAEGWRLAATTAQRRAILSKSVALHQKKGTLWSIVEALKTIGFDDAEVVERLAVNRYDGSAAHSGANFYDAYGWAQFRVTANAGETQPISAAATVRIVETINEWKPARCHLVDVQYRANVSERAGSAESSSTSGALTTVDAHVWGRAYDGALNYDHGALHTFAGNLRFDGAVVYSALHATGVTFNAARESDGMAASLTISDRQARINTYDGAADHCGALDFGFAAPVAEDLPMPIALTRHLHFDGRMIYSAHRHDGSDRYAGGLSYFGNTGYAGDVVTHLEA